MALEMSDRVSVTGDPVPQVYVDLAERLDTLGFGYPRTEEGFEFPLVMNLFTPDEAATFLKMPEGFNTAAVISESLGLPVRMAEMRLASMAHKGIIYREERDGELMYSTVPLAHGLYEFGVAQASPSWMPYALQHFVMGAGVAAWQNEIGVWRYTPNPTALEAGTKVLPVDDAEAIIRSKDRIVVAPCICRTSSKIVQGYDCPHEYESCFAFDKFGDFYVENGTGRYVTVDEALDIVRKARDEGCIIEVANTSSVEQMCCCCTCCCGPLMVLKMFGGKAQGKISNFYAASDEGSCLGSCHEVCISACPMDALSLEDEKIAVDRDRCIGCGRCAVACKNGGIKVVKKAEDEIYVPQDKTYFDTYAHIKRLRDEAAEEQA